MMNKESLYNCYALRREVVELRKRHDELYNTYKSPALVSTGSHGNTPSDPTSQAFYKLLELEEEYNDALDKAVRQLADVQHWLNKIDDPDLGRLLDITFLTVYHGWKQPTGYGTMKGLTRQGSTSTVGLDSTRTFKVSVCVRFECANILV